MIDTLPDWVEILFFAAFIATVLLFYYANGKSKILTLLIIVWSVAHAVLAYSGFYQATDHIPPRFGLVLLPATLMIIFGLLPNQRKWVLNHRNISLSTFLHTVRIPVEVTLLYLYFDGMVPRSMTFEGMNFDILAGITAPIVGILLLKGKISRVTLLAWNLVGIILVSTILVIGILSAELPFQQFAFDQPNRAVNYIPFILLPATIVPIVFYTHLTDILILSKGKYL